MEKHQILKLAAVWVVVFLVVGLVYKFAWKPSAEQKAEQAAEQAAVEERDALLNATSSDSRYDRVVNFAIDDFSGYAPFREYSFGKSMARSRSHFVLKPDNADYMARFESIRKGETHMGVFTLDALIQASAEFGDLPVVVVGIIDETRGADAAVAYKDSIPNLDALNDPEVKFVLLEGSASETMSRVIMSQFNLSSLQEDPFIFVESPDALYKKWRLSKHTDPFVFVTWEPYVGKMLENPNTHKLIDSSRFRGYVVDVVVVSRDYLVSNEPVVAEVMKNYFTNVYKNTGKMADMVTRDVASTGGTISTERAETLASGIWWKNTVENQVHFGFRNEGDLQHIEDMIANITKVLETTGAIKSDPTNGQPNLLYYNGIIEDLYNSNWHPGKESVRDDKIVLAALTDSQWDSIKPSGTLDVPNLVFSRGTSKLTNQSTKILDGLINKLETLPTYYILVQGDTTTKGNLELNKKLAASRAEVASQYLISKGLDKNRVHARAKETPSGRTAVDFILGELPY